MKSTLTALPVQSLELLTTQQLRDKWARSEPLELGDPCLERVEYNLQQTYYPLGFPVHLSTNSSEVQEIAAACWSKSRKLFDVKPIKLAIGVAEGRSSGCPAPPLCRLRENLASNIADAENFAISDYAQGLSLVWVTRAAIEQVSYFRYFFLISTVMGQIANCHAWGIHAACVELQGAGILLCGDSGAGKSTLAYACARAGFTYITDDGSYLVDGRDDRLIVGDCGLMRFRPGSQDIFPELRGMPVLQRAEVGKPSLEFGTALSQKIATSPTSRIRYVIFINRNVDQQELAPFPVEVARQYMLQRGSMYPPRRTRQTRMFDRLLECAVLELRYTDLDWAVERLSQLAREGR